MLSSLLRWAKREPLAPGIIGLSLTVPIVPVSIVAGAAVFDAGSYLLRGTAKLAILSARGAYSGVSRYKRAKEYKRRSQEASSTIVYEPPKPTKEEQAASLFERYRKNIGIIASSPLDEDTKAAFGNLELQRLEDALRQVL